MKAYFVLASLFLSACVAHSETKEIVAEPKTLSTAKIPPQKKEIKIPEQPQATAKICAGAFHSCAARKEGSVYCWGDNPFGNDGYQPAPIKSRDLQNVVGLSCGE